MLNTTSSRIVGTTNNSVMKCSGRCNLEDEINRFELYRKNGLLVPRLLSFNKKQDRAEFELIKGEQGRPSLDEEMYQRGFMEGRMAKLGFYHPIFSTSFDDTVRTPAGLYIIDCDEQITMSPQRTYLAYYQFGDLSTFRRKTLPSISHKDLELKNTSHPYLKGYEEGLGEEINIDENQLSSSEIDINARCSGL